MTAGQDVHSETVESVLDVDLRVRRAGSGRRVVFLHGEDGLLFSLPFVEMLSSRYEVVCPLHPGWGSPRPAHVRSLDDISYVYLEWLDRMEGDVVVVGVSVGAWLAAQIATKSEHRMSTLVLVSPVGIKTGGREQRTFVDLYASPPATLTRALYGNPDRAPDLTTLSDDQFLELAVSQEAVARFAWEPYLHDPQLGYRLQRIRKPTLIVAGSDDRFVLDPDYYRHYGSLIGANATISLVEGAGHRIEEERPEALCDVITSFMEGDR